MSNTRAAVSTPLVAAFLVFSLVLFALTPISFCGAENLGFGVSEGDQWALLQYYQFQEQNETAQVVYRVINVSDASVWLNQTYVYETEEGTSYFSEVFVYNFSKLEELLNNTLTWGEILPLLPTAWEYVRGIVRSLDEELVNVSARVYSDGETIGGHYTTEVVLEVLTNTTYEARHVVLMYSERTGILLGYRMFISYHGGEYNYSSWSALLPENTTVEYWDVMEYVENVEPAAAATSASGVIAGTLSAAAAMTVSYASTTAVGTATTTAPSVTGEITAPEQRRFSWKYLKHVLKLRKLVKRRKKEEGPRPPTNSIPFTVGCAAVGAGSGLIATHMVPGIVFGLNPLLSIIAASSGLALAGAGISLFIRRWKFYKRYKMRVGKKEKFSLLSALAGGMYGAVACPLSLAMVLKAISAVVVPVLIPAAFLAIYTYLSLKVQF